MDFNKKKDMWNKRDLMYLTKRQTDEKTKRLEKTNRQTDKKMNRKDFLL